MTDVRCEWALVTPPTVEPITPNDAIDQARSVPDAELGLLYSYIVTARQTAEDYMARGLLTQTWKLVLSWFEDVIWLPMAAPLQSVTTVKYYDAAGVLQTLASSAYVVNTTSRPGCLELAPNQSWPSVQSGRQFPVEITYVVGWTDADLVPERIKQGIRSYVAYMHYDREGMDERAKYACEAATMCWSDIVHWKPPACVWR